MNARNYVRPKWLKIWLVRVSESTKINSHAAITHPVQTVVRLQQGLILNEQLK